MQVKEKLDSQQCRACYNANKGLKLLSKCAGGGLQKSYAELLTEITNINMMADSSLELPKFICDSCSRKLKSAYAFVQQTHEVNERLMAMLISREQDSTNQLDCLDEAQVDIQSCLEIKMEHDDTAAETEITQMNLKLEVPEGFAINFLDNNEEMNGEQDEQENNKELDSLNQIESTEDIYQINATNTNDLATDYMKPLNDLLKDEEENLHDLNKHDDNEYQDNNYSSDDLELCQSKEQLNSSIKPKQLKKQSKKIEDKIEKPPEDEDVAVPCLQCNKIFSNSKALTRHQRTSHIPEEQKCTCPLCFRKFSRSCNMYTHMRTFHGPDTVPLIRKPSTEERTFQCDKCPRNYTKKKHLNIHIKNKHSNENKSKQMKSEISTDKDPTNNEGVPAKPNKTKRYEVRSLCSICGSSFSSKTHLTVHMRRHTGERPFKCDLCDRAYPRISELTCHRRIHTGEKPFACKICGKTFRVSSKMTTHMRSHTDIRPYKCTQCERSFKYSKDLSIHFRIHTGERPYKCNICGRTFTQSNTLKAHRSKLGHMDVVMENVNNLMLN
ncbi:uncharacterized protein ACRADG_013065 [Cochliomyia hominivorax]